MHFKSGLIFLKHQMTTIKKNDYVKSKMCKSIVILFLLFNYTTSYGQDGIFSQYYASSLYLNPAMAGVQSDISVNTNYRLQWLNISPYSLSQFSFIYPITSNSRANQHHWGGAGLSMFQERSGVHGSYQNKGANMSFAYNLPINRERRHFLSFGLQGGFVQQQIDIEKYEWGSKYTGSFDNEPGIGDQYQLTSQKMYADLNAGAVWYYEGSKTENEKKLSAFFGVSGYHLNNPNHSLIEGITIKVPRIIKLHSGIKIPLSQRINLSPSVIFANQNKVQQFNGGAYLSYLINDSETGYFAKAEILGGMFHRLKDANIFMIGLSSKFFTMGFSYDMNTSTLKQFTGGKGAYEISLSLRFPRSLKTARYDTPRI